MKIYQSESTVRPPKWDLTSAPGKVYHNKDVQTVPAGQDKPEMFSYTVEEYTLAEYQQYANTRQDDIEAAVVELAEIIAGG